MAGLRGGGGDAGLNRGVDRVVHARSGRSLRSLLALGSVVVVVGGGGEDGLGASASGEDPSLGILLAIFGSVSEASLDISRKIQY